MFAAKNLQWLGAVAPTIHIRGAEVQVNQTEHTGLPGRLRIVVFAQIRHYSPDNGMRAAGDNHEELTLCAPGVQQIFFRKKILHDQGDGLSS